MKKNLSLLISINVVIVLIIVVFIISSISYFTFTKSLTNEYNDASYHTALTAASMIDVDKIDTFLETNGESKEYKELKEKMDLLCHNQDVSVINVIRPDRDYKHYTVILDVINTNSGYEKWEIGEVKSTTNETYEK